MKLVEKNSALLGFFPSSSKLLRRSRVKRSTPYVLDNSSNEFSEVRCESPRVIIRRDLRKLYFQSVASHLGETVKTLDEYVRFRKSLLSNLDIRHITMENIHDYFLVTSEGQIVDCYLCVPCGSCDVCRARKSNVMAFRAECESVTSRTCPLFVTLTYSPEYLPCRFFETADGHIGHGYTGLHFQDVRDFLKRLRMSLLRAGYDNHFRYLMCGEYGHLNGRPHYHLIIYDLCSDLHQTRFFKFVQRAWSKYTFDLATGKKIRVARSDGSWYYKTHRIGRVQVDKITKGCSGYVCKYMRKQFDASDVPDGGLYYISRVPPKVTQSTRGGGLGSAYLREQRGYVENNPTALLGVTPKYGGRRTPIYSPVVGSLSDFYFPSFSRQLNSKDYEYVRMFLKMYTDYVAICHSFFKDVDVLDVQKTWKFFDFANIEYVPEEYIPIVPYAIYRDPKYVVPFMELFEKVCDHVLSLDVKSIKKYYFSISEKKQKRIKYSVNEKYNVSRLKEDAVSFRLRYDGRADYVL